VDPGRSSRRERRTATRNRVRIFSVQRKREGDPAKTVGHIALVHTLDANQMRPERRFNALRKHRPSVFLSLPAPHQKLMLIEVDVLHAGLETLLQAEP
jgi:hypothetical protein